MSVGVERDGDVQNAWSSSEPDERVDRCRLEPGASNLDPLIAVSLGVILLDGTGAVLFANDTAEAVIGQNDGLYFARNRSAIRANDKEENLRLRRLISEVMQPPRGSNGTGALAVSRPSHRSALRVVVAPLRASGLNPVYHARLCAIVFVSDPEQPPRICAEILAALFRLLPAEVRLVMRLIEGDSVARAAQALGISVNTVRTQLKSIFAKIGCNRQSDLIRVVLTSPAYLANPPR